MLVAEFGKQRLDRIARRFGVDVDHQAMAVLRHRIQGEDLGFGFLLEVDDYPHDVGTELTHPYALDVGVLGRDLARQALEDFVEAHARQVDHQAVGIGDELVFEMQRLVRLQRDSRIVFGRPGAHGDEGRSLRPAQAGREGEGGKQRTRLAEKAPACGA